MEIAKCKCGYRLEKPTWEHLICTIYKAGGHAGKNKCPGCKGTTLEFKARR